MNRRVIEHIIKAGALDFGGVPRSALLEALLQVPASLRGRLTAFLRLSPVEKWRTTIRGLDPDAVAVGEVIVDFEMFLRGVTRAHR